MLDNRVDLCATTAVHVLVAAHEVSTRGETGETAIAAAAGLNEKEWPHEETDAAPENIDGDDGGHAIGDFEPYGQ